MVAFPLPKFPPAVANSVLDSLLRTKLEPNVVEWVEQGEALGRGEQNSQARNLSDSERHELWQWAPSAANVEARKQKWGADYTLAEKQAGVEHVVTSLRRELMEPLDEDDGEEDEYDEVTDDEEDDADKMDVEGQAKSAGASTAQAQSLARAVIAPPMPLESVHRFMTTGKVG